MLTSYVSQTPLFYAPLLTRANRLNLRTSVREAVDEGSMGGVNSVHLDDSRSTLVNGSGDNLFRTHDLFECRRLYSLLSRPKARWMSDGPLLLASVSSTSDIEIYTSIWTISSDKSPYCCAARYTDCVIIANLFGTSSCTLERCYAKRSRDDAELCSQVVCWTI